MAITYTLQDNINNQTFSNDSARADYLPIARTAVTTSGDLQRNVLSLNIAGDRADEHPWSQYIGGSPGLGNVQLTITDTVAGRVLFRGLLFNCTVTPQTIKLDFSSPLNAGAVAESRTYQRVCPYYLYEQRTCKADLDGAKATRLQTAQTKAVESVDDTLSILTLASAVVNPTWFTNGSMIYNDVSYWVNGITNIGKTVHLRAPVLFPAFIADVRGGNNPEVTLHAACDKTLATCTNRFENAENFGGQPSYQAEQRREESNTIAADFTRDLISSALRPETEVKEGEHYHEHKEYRVFSLDALRGREPFKGPRSINRNDGTAVDNTYKLDLTQAEERHPELFSEVVLLSAPTLVRLRRTFQSITIQYTFPPDGIEITSKELRISPLSASPTPWEEIGGTSRTGRHTFSGLTQNTAYKIEMRGRSFHGAGEVGTLSAGTLLEVIVEVPKAPTLDYRTDYVSSDSTATVTFGYTFAVTETVTSIEYRYTEGDEVAPFTKWIVAGDGTSTSVTISGLKPRTTYSWQFRGVNDDGNGAITELTDTTAAAPPVEVAPGAPTGLKSAPTETTIVASWTAPTGTVTDYEVRIGTSVTWQKLGSTSTTHTFTGLTHNTSYTWRVRALNDKLIGTEASATTKTLRTISVPNAPTDLKATTTHSSIDITWKAATTGDAATKWQIRIATGSTAGGEWTDTKSTSLDFSFIGLTAEQQYTMQVRGVNNGGNGAAATLMATTDAAPLVVPGAPTGLQSTPTQTTIVALWSAPSGTVTGYEVRITTGNTAGGTWTDIDSTDTTYTFTGLTANTAYTWQVRALNSTVRSQPATATITTLDNAPSAPTITLGVRSATSLAVSWTRGSAGGAPTSYQVRITTGSTAGGTWVSATGTSHTFSSLKANTRYTMQVRGVNNGGNGAAATQTATTNAAPPPRVAPVIPWVLGRVRSSGVDVVWDYENTIGEPSTHAEYRIDSGRWTRLDASTNRRVSLTVRNKSTYTVSVRGVNTTHNLTGNAVTINVLNPAETASSAPASINAGPRAGGQGGGVNYRVAWGNVSSSAGTRTRWEYRHGSASLSGWMSLSASANRILDFANLTPSTYYEVQVREVTNVGFGAAAILKFRVEPLT